MPPTWRSPYDGQLVNCIGNGEISIAADVGYFGFRWPLFGQLLRVSASCQNGRSRYKIIDDDGSNIRDF